ncbi:MAG: hypothetical protein OP8BY_2389 [Candidatus Saccharicenans subterraneus]|uniref:Uncharacterized protein n=1 Tax=Candidatus Saccharicenans subterraneus TaxID=2508984 RepID=A0A3E2BJ46_9BACT|nr:MAG: hypothetical protein OP8BY_2389 [Candidatus Saccharicenans subterraneum]
MSCAISLFALIFTAIYVLKAVVKEKGALTRPRSYVPVNIRYFS